MLFPQHWGNKPYKNKIIKKIVEKYLNLIFLIKLKKKLILLKTSKKMIF